MCTMYTKWVARVIRVARLGTLTYLGPGFTQNPGASRDPSKPGSGLAEWVDPQRIVIGFFWDGLEDGRAVFSTDVWDRH